MRIWADGDSCTAAARQFLFALADRRRIVLTLVCSKPHQWPNSAYIRSLLVSEGFEGVNQRLQQLAEPGDVVVSDEGPLLKALVAKKVKTLTPGDVRELDDLLEQIERQAAATAAALQRQGKKKDAEAPAEDAE